MLKYHECTMAMDNSDAIEVEADGTERLERSKSAPDFRQEWSVVFQAEAQVWSTKMTGGQTWTNFPKKSGKTVIWGPPTYATTHINLSEASEVAEARTRLSLPSNRLQGSTPRRTRWMIDLNINHELSLLTSL